MRVNAPNGFRAKIGQVRQAGGWPNCLTDEQVATVRAVRARHSFLGREHDSGSDGWTVFHHGTTVPATYLELRHYLTGGKVARWVIEKDGTISAMNELGDLKELVKQ